MKRRIKCPNCKTEFEVSPDLMNRNLRCRCGIKFHVAVLLPRPTLVQTDEGIKFLRTDEYLAVCDGLETCEERFFSMDNGRSWIDNATVFESLKISCTVVSETPKPTEPLPPPEPSPEVRTSPAKTVPLER